MPLNSISRLWQNREGTALVEGALVVPVLFVLFFGVFEFSHIFYQQHLMSTGVRDAARYLARTADPTDGTAQLNAQNLAATGSISGGSYRRVSGWDPGDVAVSMTSVANPIDEETGLRPYRGGDFIQIVNVTGTLTYAPLGFWDFLGFSIPVISVTHSERAIGVS